MDIKLNGKAVTLEQELLPLLELLVMEGLDPALAGIAVAINYSVVPRSEWPLTKVKPGDEIELITALQGG